LLWQKLTFLAQIWASEVDAPGNDSSINFLGADANIGTFRLSHTAYINYGQFATISASALGKTVQEFFQ